MILRGDQLASFVYVATGDRVRWLVSNKGDYHATANGTHAVCGTGYGRGHFTLSDADPRRLVADRSADPWTCALCAEAVRRIRAPRPVDLNEVLRRARVNAWRSGTRAQGLLG